MVPIAQPTVPRLLGNIPNVDFAWCASAMRVPMVGAPATAGSAAVATPKATTQGIAASAGYLRVNAIIPSMYLTTWTEFGVVLLDSTNRVETVAARNQGQAVLFFPATPKVDLVIWGAVDVDITGGTLPTGIVHYVARRNGSAHSVWLNGKLYGTASVANTPAAAVELPAIGADSGSGGGEGGSPLVSTTGMLSVIRTPVPMSDTFCLEASRNHWQLYQPQIATYFLFAPPAVAGTTIVQLERKIRGLNRGLVRGMS